MSDLDSLLAKTSRTFALSIPPLPEPTRREVTIAYLLFRIADTFEDAAHWPEAQRIAALEAFCGLLASESRTEAARLAVEWTAAGASPHAGYAELIREVPFVLDAFRRLRPEAVAPIRTHVERSARGMAGVVTRSASGRLSLTSIDDLKAYCYVVAGIVGEMLTELFLLGRDNLVPVADALRARAATFGEALQLVNILKDSAQDAAEGRDYLSAAAPRAEVFALARADLESAMAYILTLQQAKAPRGILEFTALPVRLARATLERVELSGPGAKLTRLEVAAIVAELRMSLDLGRAAVDFAAGSRQ